MRYVLIVVMALWAVPSVAQQDQTLADIRQELSVLFVEIQRLKQELSTTGSPQGVSGSLLDRVNGIESQLQAMTAKTEELEFRINRIVEDGTNRIGDLEFRLVELEGGDISTLGETSTLGGEVAAPAAPAPAPAPSTAGLTVNESADFGQARDALSAGDFAIAADRFGAFVLAYPGGPMTIDAMYLKGEAHEGLGEMRQAARAYLDAFTADPVGPRAPDALYKVGSSLGALDQIREACVTLAEVGVRFPGGEAAGRANATRQTLGCS